MSLVSTFLNLCGAVLAVLFCMAQIKERNKGVAYKLLLVFAVIKSVEAFCLRFLL